MSQRVDIILISSAIFLYQGTDLNLLQFFIRTRKTTIRCYYYSGSIHTRNSFLLSIFRSLNSPYALLVSIDLIVESQEK
uniref:Uncharacterized protein n=1 Tax=Nelumbo nucifera TaxID=4432 RepID=A0A822Z8Q1_NELNU|nr:TPA_asm: hypothetical protein HUJ06_000954 [Nelumbo nucifera]